MSHQIEPTLKQAGPARRTFLKHLSGGIAAALIALFSSNAQATRVISPPADGVWMQMPGPAGVTLKQISVGSENVIWVLDTAGYPWKRNGLTWEKKAGPVSTISAAPDGTLWATNPTRVLKLDLVNNKWTSNIPTGMKQVAVNNTTVWGLDNAGTLFQLKGTTWEKKLGTVSQISVGTDGTLWATYPPDSKRVLRWDGLKWDKNLPTGMVSVSVGNANNIWALDSSDQVFQWTNSAWAKRPGALRNIAAAGDGTVWGITAQGSVYKWFPSNKPPRSMPLPASQCGTDYLFCCNTVQQADTSVVSVLLSLQQVVVSPITALVGANCAPIDATGIGSGGQCTAQPVCCLGTEFRGLFVTHCEPVTVGR